MQSIYSVVALRDQVAPFRAKGISAVNVSDKKSLDSCSNASIRDCLVYTDVYHDHL